MSNMKIDVVKMQAWDDAINPVMTDIMNNITNGITEDQLAKATMQKLPDMDEMYIRIRAASLFEYIANRPIDIEPLLAELKRRDELKQHGGTKQ